ncbi:TipJ family phage tail tip protein [Proteus mirabilis]|uniref:TipJ family phage tail tip protein n=1 Tax=Proteus mirabilis TaxID=584 RepID=UPI002575D9DF|nr:phage tail protein [Proteus mirabilis]MDM3616605.1 phage tail protein [Proteus mirabilis]
MELIHGAKGGGGGGHTPTESPDSLLSESTAKILLAISEGEIAGGLDDTRIFLDDTPIGNADGTKNFEGVTWEFRPGSEHQEYIQGIPSVDSETSVGLELKDDQPYVRSINNTQLSAVRIRLSVPQLFQQHDNGDTTGYRIEYAIDLSTDGAGYNEVLKSAFDGKTTSEYQRTHRIDLPKANTGWQIRVRRLTKNQNTARIADKVTISAVTDVIDAKLRYPNTALLFITFNARQFNNRIPKISVRPKGGLLIKVPTNYDPINRTYSGVWDGTFKLAATNNPAWVFYDLVLNNRYGCGDRIKASQIEKWDLYKIAQYCDELVPDGHGGDGKEPRFLCDVYVQSQESAYQVLRDIAAIFRGMTFWADNKVNVVADMPDSIFRTFTNANIVGGKPAYSGGSQQNRYTQALVSYTDTNNHSNDVIEAVADIKLQRRYGVRKTEISAIGCTRQTEANRRGRWALLTNANDRVISFATGLEGAIPSPGHIIAVADSTLAGRDNGGRISRVEGRKITLDRRANIKAGDRLIVNLPNGRSEGRTVSLVADNIITVSTEYSQEPEKNAVWTVDADDLALQLYRVVNITDNGDNTYTITGAIHNPSNYDHIDSGARIDERPITIVPPGVQAPPKNIRISSYSQVNQGISFTTLRVDWDTVDNAITYEAQWRRDNNNWVSMPRSSTCGFEVDGIYAGRYQVRVRAINASEISSVWANAQETTLTGKVGNPPKPVNFRASSLVFGIKLDWGFGENTGDTLKTEIQYSKKNDGEGLMLLSDVPYPSKTYEMAGLAAGVIFYFRARLVDKTGNQSEWTDFIRGESEFDTSTILPELGNHFMTTEAGKQLDEKLNWNTESIAELVNATYELSTDLLVRDGNAQAGIKELRKVFANQQEAWAQEIKEIYSAVGENKSAIEETQTSITKLDEAFGQRFTAIRTDMDNAQADIISNSQAISNTNKAFAENKTQVQAKFDEQEGMIQEKMQATFKQSGDGVVIHSINITIKHNGVSYNAAGQVISAQVKNGKLESFFGYNANNFAWYNPVNGKMELFMYAKNGQLFIRDLFIEDGSITNAKIGNVIQSNNYLNGRPGWIINKNGFAEFQNIKARGEIEATSGRLKNVVIEESCDILGKLKVENLEGNIVTVTQDVYHNLSFSHDNIVELFKVKRRTQKCFIWVQGALNPYERIPNNGVKPENRSAFAYRAPFYRNGAGAADIYIDGVIQPRPSIYNMEDTATSDFYAVNEFVLELSPGEGVASIGIKIPQGGSETTRFIMRARIIVFPDNQDVIFN